MNNETTQSAIYYVLKGKMPIFMLFDISSYVISLSGTQIQCGWPIGFEKFGWTNSKINAYYWSDWWPRIIKFQQVAERIINICTEQGLHNLKNPIQFRQCLELVDMKCDKNDVCRYDGYTKTENENGGTWNRIEYSISIDIKKGWTSLNIEAEWKRNYKANSERKQPAPDGIYW